MKEGKTGREADSGLSTVLTILITVLVAAGLGAGAYFGYNWWQDQAQKDTGQTTQPTTPPDPSQSWKTYTDSVNGFSIEYPPDWTIKEGSFPSDHGQTLKDVSFSGGTDRVFITVRTNPDGTLEAFVNADGVADIKPAKVVALDGFAAVASGAYRVYLGKDDKIYMFTFPGAATNTDLSDDQVNLLTSFQFTSGASSATTDQVPLDVAKNYYSGQHGEGDAVPTNMVTKRVNDCLTMATANRDDLGLTDRPSLYTYCGLEGEKYFAGTPANLTDITFKEIIKSDDVTVYELSDKSGVKLFKYSLLLEDNKWRVDRIEYLAT